MDRFLPIKSSTSFSELGVLCVFALAPWNTDSTKIACSPEVLFHRASHLFSDSVIQNSTENFKYL